jgi:hypothetical protein
MSERDERRSAPSRADVAEVLRRLVEGSMSREDASEWASPWVTADDVDFEPPLWRAIERLSGAGMISTERPYLYEPEDFQAWLEELLGPSPDGGADG